MSKAPKKIPKRKTPSITIRGGGGGGGKSAVSAATLTRLGPNQTLKQLEKMTKLMTTFVGSVENLKVLMADRVANVDEHCELAIGTLKSTVEAEEMKIANLKREFTQKFNDERIVADQALREFGLTKAVQIADQNNKALIDKSTLAALQSRVTELETLLATQADDIRGAMTKTHAAQMAAQKSHMELQAEKKAAMVDAQYQAAQGQIKILTEQLAHAQHEVAASRELVASVANARSAQPVMMATAPRSDRDR